MRSKNVEPKVARILSESMVYRNSDKELLLAFWEAEGLSLNSYQRQAFLDCTPAESITRARRNLRDQYPGSKEVEEGRYERFQEEQDDHSDGGAIGGCTMMNKVMTDEEAYDYYDFMPDEGEGIDEL